MTPYISNVGINQVKLTQTIDYNNVLQTSQKRS